MFQSSGFRDWKNAMGNKSGVIVCHHNSRAHMEATSKAMSYKSVIEGKAKTFVLVCLMHMRRICKRKMKYYSPL